MIKKITRKIRNIFLFFVDIVKLILLAMALYNIVPPTIEREEKEKNYLRGKLITNILQVLNQLTHEFVGKIWIITKVLCDLSINSPSYF